MGLGLTVVTHTRCSRNNNRLLICEESVKNALPVGAVHKIIELGDVTTAEFASARCDAINCNDVVIFVDDDDYISPNSLHYCMHVMNTLSPGVVFTDEVFVRTDGMCITRQHATTYSELISNPGAIHHMVAIQSRYVTNKSLDLATKYGCLAEWCMTAEASITALAKHISHDGYYWVQHANQQHNNPTVSNIHASCVDLISKELTTWITESTPTKISTLYFDR